MPGLLFNRIFKRQVSPQCGINRLRCLGPCGGHVSVQCLVNLHLAFQYISQRIQRGCCVALDKVVAGVAPVMRQRIRINAVKRPGQFELVPQRFVAAQACAHSQHGVAALVQVFSRFLQVVRPEACRVVFGNDAAPLYGRDHAPAYFDEALSSSACAACATAQPQQRAFGGYQPGCQCIDLCSIRLQGRQCQRCQVRRQVHQAGLNVNRYLNADRPAWRRERQAMRFTKRGQSCRGIAYAKGGLAYRLQHSQLLWCVVNIAQVAVQVIRFNLPGQVQHRRARGQCLDQCTRCIASPCTDTGDAHAQAARYACVGIGHVAGTRLTTGRHKADFLPRVEGIENRHVVNRDHTERGLGTAKFQKADGEFAHGDLGV